MAKDVVATHVWCWCTGITASNELDNAVLGGASDFISDITTKMYAAVFAKEDEKVIIVVSCREYNTYNILTGWQKGRV